MLSVNFFEVNLQNIDTRCCEKKKREGRERSRYVLSFSRRHKRNVGDAESRN